MLAAAAIDSMSVNMDNSVFEPASRCQSQSQSQAGKYDPSNAEIVECHKGISSRIQNIDLRLNKLDTLEQKVSGFESELKKTLGICPG